jgi:3-dehydroquinate synthase
MDKTPTGVESAENLSNQPLVFSAQMLRDAIGNASTAGILTDNKVFSHCWDALVEWIPEAAQLPVLEISSGEQSKNIRSLEMIFDFLSSRFFDRHSLLICFGGGMVTDLGGFAASVFKRGIPCIYIPTTLMAMTDAAWGGKTGLDYNGIKNLLGTFEFRTPVALNAIFLKTLPERRFREALAEMIKHELLAGFVSLNSAEILFQNNSDMWFALILKHVRMKMDWVGRDPKEKNLRKCLNLGHTLGHALEGFYLQHEEETFHGECVAVGLIFSLLLSVEICSFPKDMAIAHAVYISTHCLSKPVKMPSWNELQSFLIHDKKNLKKSPKWVLLGSDLLPVLDVEVPELRLMTLYQSDSFREFLQ